MNKQQILSEYKNQDDKLILAKILDKIEFTHKKNKIENTDFLDMYQINLVDKFLRKLQINNYILFGGFEDAERKIAIFYPEKFNSEIVKKNFNKILKVIKLNLSEEVQGKYSHRDYLGGIIKLGIKREKVGDIIVDEKGADIIILDEISEFLLQNICSLTRFSDAVVTLNTIENLRQVNIKKQEYNIIVPSFRLDSIVSELAKCSRNKSVEIISTERVFINGQNELKLTKQVKIGDTITIRGKGRFIIKELVGNTRSQRYILKVEKFV